MDVIVPVQEIEGNKILPLFLFMIKKPNGSYRLIINLKKLNRFIKYKHFKMESIKSATPLIGKNYFLCTIDLKDAYYHVPICQDHQKYLRFTVRSPGGKILHFQFKALPFGISSAPRIFTKIMAEVVAYLRLKGIIIVPYLDDLLLVAKTKLELKTHLQIVIGLLQDLGWVINKKKSDLKPETVKKFLGVKLDSVKQSSFLPLEKIQKIKENISLFQRKESCSIRAALSLLGLLTSCIQCVSWAQNHTRTMQAWTIRVWDKNPLHLDHKVKIPLSVKHSLSWWKNPINLKKGVWWNPNPILTIRTDASLSGWGAALAGHYFQGQWDSQTCSRSSNFRELKAVLETFKKGHLHIKNQHIKILSDNTTTVAYLRRQGGTKSKFLSELSHQIFRWAETHFLSLSAVHLKGTENIEADFLSRVTLDPHEWSLNPQTFREICHIWGTPTLDLFATHLNNKSPKYFSLDHRGSPTGLDAFSHTWGSGLVYAFPPIPLIPKILQKLRTERVLLILIAPYWPKRSWFPVIQELAIDNPVHLPYRQDLLLQGPLYHQDVRHLKLTAWILRGHT
ncbi:hypothetical protein GDO81_008420 [Engystomops pustulosus]|uniref:ribonuclease H n=1 Tax=Engystomops pustulosus TaxID=76066 RepID=A0AAV7CEH2_ENGPU|nr:hypothetical protein GDO81_008420 [Engystomops pustulosus]